MTRPCRVSGPVASEAFATVSLSRALPSPPQETNLHLNTVIRWNAQTPQPWGNNNNSNNNNNNNNNNDNNVAVRIAHGRDHRLVVS